MADSRNIHFVGSLGMADAETAFRTLAYTVGTGAKRYPDGEPGSRSKWIQYQGDRFENDPNFQHSRTIPAGKGVGPYDRRLFKLDESLDCETVELTLGYAEEAIKSYECFQWLKSESVIAAPTRFQVSLPTPTAVLQSFIEPDQIATVEPVYERAMINEVSQIIDAIPRDQLSIQWDIATEIIAHDIEGQIRLYYEDIFEGTLIRVARLCGAVPEPVELGIHLCYGDPGHKHVVEPKDLGTSVKFTNGLIDAVGRSVQFIHMPVPRDRDDEAFYAPLNNLNLPDRTELILGLVHHTGGLAGTNKRLARAGQVVKEFGIATECGFGRRNPETISELLTIHMDAAKQ